MKKLCKLGLLYSMLFPAQLRIQVGDQTHLFMEPDAACNWLELFDKGTLRPELMEKLRLPCQRQQQYCSRRTHLSIKSQAAWEQTSAVENTTSMGASACFPRDASSTHRSSTTS
ncbi:hypothetical protein NDU88_010153 [Pleurodeles waltl]|uniref:Uncharacterized protein n=1 Tax=Pleurodeles waltl TaxID=8319 RepID=A0AAV7PUE9_PLEWA|nr:hypothetical protein NDU88_010153 [Pleurodeles waltl]